MTKRNIFILVLIAINIAIDQITKFWVRANVEAFSDKELLGKYLVLTNVENEGAFLGLGSDFNPVLKTILLLILPVIVLGFVLYHILKEKSMDRWSLIGFCLIMGGGIANVYDRIIYGSVTDFLHIDIAGPIKTGIFNMADVSVSTGLIMLVISIFLNKNEKENATE